MMNDFETYKRAQEPEKYEKAQNWLTAIGLQQVDGLTPTAYLFETAKANIEGDITIDEVKSRLDSYYKEIPLDRAERERVEEADKVSARITEILGEKTFSLTPTEFISIHKRLFDGIYSFAGKVRDYNITKSEWVLCGDTVFYVSALNLHETLEYDINRERSFSFKGLSKSQMISHISDFISNLWQIHPFGEGNTRTTAVFLIKYLRKLGFTGVNNDMFAKNSFYFRNALVRANYANVQQSIHKTNEYLVRFLENLLENRDNPLDSKALRIRSTSDDTVKTTNDTVKTTNDTVKTTNDTVNTAVDTVNTTVDTVNVVKNNENIVNDTVYVVNNNEEIADDTVNVVNNNEEVVDDTVNVVENIENIVNDTVNAENDTVNTEDDTVFDIIKANTSVTAQEIAKMLGISLATVRRRIRKLKNDELIERIGSDKTGYWKIL